MKKSETVTIMSCTPDSSSELFQRHIKNIQKYTLDYEHIIFDNHYSDDFNHAREINRAMSICKSRYLVILDDDLIVQKNWLNALLSVKNNDPKTIVIGGIHRYENQTINHAGAYLTHDGVPGHYLKSLKNQSCFSYICSAIMLIDVKWCQKKNIGFNENYMKYYQDADFCLSVWNHGGRVSLTPGCDVLHLVGQRARMDKDIYAYYSKDREYFSSRWIDSGYYSKILKKINKLMQFGNKKDLDDIETMLNDYNKASIQDNIKAYKEFMKTHRLKFVSTHGHDYLSKACYKLGIIYKKKNKIYESLNWFKKCVKYNPHHQKAQAELENIKGFY